MLYGSYDFHPFPFSDFAGICLFYPQGGTEKLEKYMRGTRMTVSLGKEMLYALFVILHLTNNSLKSPNFILIEGYSLLIEVSSLSWHGIFF